LNLGRKRRPLLVAFSCGARVLRLVLVERPKLGALLVDNVA
jgi:hypothetical protein